MLSGDEIALLLVDVGDILLDLADLGAVDLDLFAVIVAVGVIDADDILKGVDTAGFFRDIDAVGLDEGF